MVLEQVPLLYYFVLNLERDRVQQRTRIGATQTPEFSTLEFPTQTRLSNSGCSVRHNKKAEGEKGREGGKRKIPIPVPNRTRYLVVQS